MSGPDVRDGAPRDGEVTQAAAPAVTAAWSGASLRAVTATGVLWSGVSSFGRQGLTLVTAILVSRLLGPDEAGLIVTANVALGLLALFTDLGLGSALVQRREIPEPLPSTLFWTSALVGVLASASLVAAAPAVAAFYHEPRLVPIVRVLAVVPALTAMAVVPQALLERRLDFRRVARREVAAVAAGAAVGVSGALLGFGAWSLVAQAIVGSATSAALLLAGCGWRPRSTFDPRALASVGRFSLGLTAFGFVNFFARTLDNILIARTFGVGAAAWYARGYDVILQPLRVVSAVVARVAYPALTRVGDDDVRFRAAFGRFCGFIAFVTHPAIVTLAVLADDFVLALLGPAWEPVTPVVRILAPVAIVQVVGTMVGLIYQARAATGLMFRVGTAVNLVHLTAIVVGLRWGVTGVAACYAISVAVTIVPTLAVPFRLVGLRLRDLVRETWRTLACSGLAGAAAGAAGAAVPAGWAALLAGTATAAAAYALATLALNRAMFAEARDLVRLARAS